MSLVKLHLHLFFYFLLFVTRYSILPDWYVHLNDLSSDNDRASADAYQSKPPIIGFDNLSKWQR